MVVDCGWLKFAIQEWAGKIFEIEVTISMILEEDLSHLRDKVNDELEEAYKDYNKGDEPGMQEHLDKAGGLSEEADEKEAKLMQQLQSLNNDLVTANERYRELKAEYCANGCERRTH